MKTRPARRAQQGFAQAYLIAVIALFSLTAYAMSQMYDANNQIRWKKGAADLLSEQLLLIRKQVIACGTSFPDGLNNDINSLSHYKKYPSSNLSLAAITCPGAPIAEEATFGGRDGAYLRKLPPEFSNWGYANNSAGLTVTLRALSPRGQEVFTTVSGRFTPVETSVAGDLLTFVVAAP